MKPRRLGLLLLAAGLLAGCSTITTYPLDIASESPVSGTMTEAEAVQIIKTRVRVSGEIADYRSFLVDERGFSYTKTSEKTKTEWKKDKPNRVKSTHTLTRNVPWNAVVDLDPYLEQYDMVLGDAYRVRMRFNITEVQYGQRTRSKETFEMSCKCYEDLVDVVAALRFLTEE